MRNEFAKWEIKTSVFSGRKPQAGNRWTGLLVALLSSCLLPGQVAMAQNGDIAFQAVVGQPLGLPQLPPQGAWGEVINVTARWLVVQNHSGQQFPIAIDDIQEFLIRWPTSMN